jgi:hypothetical protein
MSLCILFIADRITGNLLEYQYFKAKSGVISRINYSMNGTSEDLLVFGTSRANHHYDSKIFEDSLSLSVYNTGKEGHKIFYQIAILKAVLKRYKPRQIILDFAGTFEFKQKDYDRLSTLLPYYDTNPEIRDIILLKSKTENLKILLSKLYRYNSQIITIIFSSLELNSKKKNQKKSYNGYVPLFGEFKNPKESTNFPLKFEVDQNKIDAFTDFIHLCKKNDIPLTIINSPLFFEIPKKQTIKLVEEICLEENIEFLDFSSDKSFIGKRELFKDKDHLNNTGAEYFTNKVISHFK